MTMLRYNAKNAKIAQRLRERAGALTPKERAWIDQWEREHPIGVNRVKAKKASLPTAGAHAPPPLMSSQGPSPESPHPQPPGQHDARDERETPSTESTRAAEYSGDLRYEAGVSSPMRTEHERVVVSPEAPPPRVAGPPPLDMSAAPGPAAAPVNLAELEQRAKHRQAKLLNAAGFCAGRLLKWEEELKAAGYSGIVDDDVVKLFGQSLYNLLDEFAPEDLGWYADAFTVAMIGSAEYRILHALRSGKLARKPGAAKKAEPAAEQRAASNGTPVQEKPAGPVDADGDELAPKNAAWG